MSKDHRALWRLAALLLSASALLAPACSSDDEATTTTAAADDGTSAEDTSGDGSGGAEEVGAAIDCGEVLTVAEVEALFGEPAILEEVDPISNSEELGQTTCTWTTVEDEANTDDLATQLLVLQYYDGSTMSGASFYDPELQYPDAEPLDLGEDAFVDATGGVNVGFLDGETSGFLSWTAIDLSGDAPEAATKKDAVVELAETFHDRAA
jgi:hypothetical protein